MTAVVLDASAILAFLFDEPGAERVESAIGSSVASAVNWSEVAQRLLQRGAELAVVRSHLIEAGLRIEPLSADDAEHAAVLRPATRVLGLSLADRCCLALAGRLGARALTADAAWAAAPSLGVRVEVIR